MLDLAPKQEYTRGDVRRMLGVSEQQLRSWERHGLIPGVATFSFSDLIALKTLQKLRENRVPPRKIGRALTALKKKLSHVEHPLSELKIFSDGRTITVQIAGQKMEALTGQLLFNFDTSELGSLKSFSPKPAYDRGSERQAESYFQKGLALEETGAPIEEAIEAYQRALELNPAAAGALVNLGTIYYRQRKYQEAEQHYVKAIEVDSNYPLAHYNLGNLYDEQGDLTRAEHHYNTALKLNPSYADAHFNLALLSERCGDFLKAVRHWKSYLRLDSTGTWANIARRQLEKLRDVALIRPRPSA
ncbi:MAG TPA: tetratricopeptide repeat protein [Bryobacteraceae bacterium]|nr:tetratricopeptide repeat protein [Bryobacteraceae bacterium]